MARAAFASGLAGKLDDDGCHSAIILFRRRSLPSSRTASLTPFLISFADACARARRAGKPIGILAPVEEDARRYLEMGFSYVAVGSDNGAAARSTVTTLNASSGPRVSSVQ